MPVRRAQSSRASRAPRRLRLVRGTAHPQPARDPAAGAASLLLPGFGQLLQGRHAPAAGHAALAGVLLVNWLTARPPRALAAALLCAWALGSAADAARRPPRPRLRRV